MWGLPRTFVTLLRMLLRLPWVPLLPVCLPQRLPYCCGQARAELLESAGVVQHLPWGASGGRERPAQQAGDWVTK